MLLDILIMKFSIFLKSFLFFSMFLIIDCQAVAQAPESMNYQAVIRDGSGNILANQSVGIRIDILQGSASGTSVYQETFTPTTNAYGSIAIQIGTGTVVSGTFNTIDWGASSYFVETAVDISGGVNYTVISTTQLMSVPYALHAKSSDAWSTNSNLNFTNNKVSVGNTSSSNVTYPLSVVSVHDGITSRGIDVLRTDNSGNNIGVPMSFSMLNSNQEPFEFGKVIGRTESNTAGSEVGGLSFHVADGTGTWGQNYQQERMRIDNGMITIKSENTISSDAILRLQGTNYNGSYSQLVDLKSTFDGHITSSKFIISTRNQGTMNDNFVVNSSGNVGIGTNSPDVKLEVNGDFRIPIGNAIRLAGQNSSQNNAHYSLHVPNFSGAPMRISLPYDGNTSKRHLHVGYYSNNDPLDTWNWALDVNPAEKITTIDNVLKLEPTSNVPSNPTKGYIYMDNSDNKLKYYNGSSWESMPGSASSSSGSNSNTFNYLSDGF